MLVQPSSDISHETLMSVPPLPSLLPSFPKPEFHMSKDDIKTLDGSEQLNDEVINYYLQLIASESPGVYVFKTNFYPKLKVKGYYHVKKSTKKVDIFAFRLVLFPIYHRILNHWSLVAAEMRTKTLYYFDSMYENDPLVIDTISNYLTNENIERHDEAIVFQQGTFPVEIPKQTNEYDCGVFVLKYAMEVIAAAEPLKCLKFSFGQEDMQDIRKAIRDKIEKASRIIDFDFEQESRSDKHAKDFDLKPIDFDFEPEGEKEKAHNLKQQPENTDSDSTNDTDDDQDEEEDSYNMDFGMPLKKFFYRSQQPTINVMKLKKRKRDTMKRIDSPNEEEPLKKKHKVGSQ